MRNPFLSRKYMVLVPSQLYTETPEKICLHLYHLNETVTVTASLISQRGTRKLFDELVVDKDLFHCLSFTVSTKYPSWFVYIFMHMRVSMYIQYPYMFPKKVNLKIYLWTQNNRNLEHLSKKQIEYIISPRTEKVQYLSHWIPSKKPTSQRKKGFSSS